MKFRLQWFSPIFVLVLLLIFNFLCLMFITIYQKKGNPKTNYLKNNMSYIVYLQLCMHF